MKRLFFFLIVIAVYLPSIAQEAAVRRSTIIEIVQGTPFYIHLVAGGQTIEAIAQAYNVTVQDIYRANEWLKESNPQGQIIKIPTKSQSQVDSQQQQQKPQTTLFPGNRVLHTVKPKETFFGISRQYDVTVKELRAANPSVETLHPGQVLIIPSNHHRTDTHRKKPVAANQMPIPKQEETAIYTYTVKPKETLFSISRRFEISVDEIKRLNPGIGEGLKAGQTLILNKPTDTFSAQKPESDTITGFRFHRVARGETLFSIAQYYNVPVRDILKFNPHANQPLQRRQVLKIPVYHVFDAKANEKKDETPAPQVNNKGAQVSLKNDKQPADYKYKTGREFKIALLIPFYLDEADTTIFIENIPATEPEKLRPFTFMQFYLGAMLAADSLAKLGMQANITVFDVGPTLPDAQRVVDDPEFRKMDLIVGPLFAQHFDIIAEFANRNKIPIINPLSTRSGLLNNNPFAVKMQPTNRRQAEIISTLINQTQGQPNIISIRQYPFSEQAIFDSIVRLSQNTPVHDVIYSRDSLKMVMENLHPAAENIIIILARNKVFSVDLVRKLHDNIGTYKIRTIGLEGWETFNIESDQKVSLRLTIPVIHHIDYNARPVQRFINSFRTKFMIEPNAQQYAFIGYDIVFYSMLSLFKTGGGEKFLQHLPYFSYRGLSMNFDFRKPAEGVGLENTGLIVYETGNYATIEVYP